MNTLEADGSDSSSDERYVFAVRSGKQSPHATVNIHGIPVSITVDSGAGANVLDVATYHKIANIAPVKPTSMKLYPYGSNKELPLRRQISAVVTSKAVETPATFYISDVGNSSLLSYDTARELKLIKVTLAAISNRPSALTAGGHMTTADIHQEYSNLFTGIDKL